MRRRRRRRRTRSAPSDQVAGRGMLKEHGVGGAQRRRGRRRRPHHDGITFLFVSSSGRVKGLPPAPAPPPVPVPACGAIFTEEFG